MTPKPATCGFLLFAAALIAALAVYGCGSNAGGCGGLTGFGNGPFTGCAGGRNIPPQSSILFEGNAGTIFRAVVSDTIGSYTFNSVVPLTMVYVNNTPPVRVVATNLSPIPSLLSIQALAGFTTQQLTSTSTPGGTISVNVGGTLPAIAPPPACDVRFFINRPAGQFYNVLLETNNLAFEDSESAPTLYLLGSAKGAVDGIFNEVTNFEGPLSVSLAINGHLASSGTGLNVTVQSGCP